MYKFSIKNFPGFILLFIFLFQPVNSLFAANSSSQTHYNFPQPFVLGSGDVLKIFVWDHKSLSFNIPINPNGKINFPLIGEIKAAGKTESELENLLTQGLLKHIKTPQVSVSLLETKSFRIYVLGEVVRSGEFLVNGSLTAVQAIAMAGGFTPFASKSRILIVNPVDGRKLNFDFEDFVKLNETQPDIFLRPGDTVIIK